MFTRLSQITALKCVSGLAFHSHCAKRNACDEGSAASMFNIPPRQKFVIIGLGTAGASAVRELLKHGDKSDSIMIVDPYARLKLHYFGLPLDSRISLMDMSLTDIDHVNRIVRFSNGAKVTFDKCLLAVGSAAPALNLMYVDPACDVASTVVDLTHLNAPYELYSILIGQQPAPTSLTTDITAQAETQCGNVALLGANCWETVHLAGKLAVAAAGASAEENTIDHSEARRSPTTNRATINERPLKARHAVTLVYPGYGPMSHTLPRYLSLALSRRLTASGVHLMPYTHVRYLGCEAVSITKNAPNVVLYTAKTYDSLNTQRTKFQKIAFAPTAVPTLSDVKEYFTALRDASKAAAEGTHCTPTSTSTSSSTTSVSSSPTTAILPQAPLLRTPHVHDFILRSGLEIDRHSGGIVVNQSLQACDGVFVAGDIASVYTGNIRTSSIDLMNKDEEEHFHAGKSMQQRGILRGYENAAYSGMVAGRNMLCSARGTEEITPKPLVYSHTPVYQASSPEMGVHFTFIGNCSSALESHGFWWRLSETNKPHSTGQLNPVLSQEDSLRPPLGLGVVFYIEEGVVAGVLISGLPPASADTVEGVDVARTAVATDRPRTYSDNVLEVGKSLIGKSARVLSAANARQNSETVATARAGSLTNSTKKKKRIGKSGDSGMLYDIDADPQESDSVSATGSVSAQSGASDHIHQHVAHHHHLPITDTANSSSSSSIIGGAVADMGETVAFLQQLSLEARRVISPVLSPALYVATPHSSSPSSTATVAASASSGDHHHHLRQSGMQHSPSPTLKGDYANAKRGQDIEVALHSYPRPLYRYGSASHTTLKDLSESVARSVVRPVQLREALFQPENVNTGSRTDNLYAAFKKKLTEG